MQYNFHKQKIALLWSLNRLPNGLLAYSWLDFLINISPACPIKSNCRGLASPPATMNELRDISSATI
jgi:hypothetical protein